MAQPELVKDIEARVKKSGDTMTGNLIGQYFQGTWLQTSQVANLGKSPSRIAVIRDDGWLYYRTPSELASDIGLTGNYVLKSGDTMTGNLTAPKFIGSLQGNASSSTYSTYTYYRDTRNANERPLDMLKGVSLHLKSNSADGLSDGLSYHPVLMLRDWNDLSGGPFAELTITGNQNLYFRSSTTSADNTWNPWRKVLTDYNYTSILNNTYLPLTGGTLTGQLVFNNNTSNQNGYPSIKWGTIQSNTPFIGYATDQSDGTFIITSLKGTTYSTGLAIGGSSQNLLYKGQIILNVSNFNQYAPSLTGSGASGTWSININGNATSATKATQDGNGAVISSTYLPLAGGTMTGALTINNTLTVNNAKCSINYGVAQYCSNMKNIQATQGLNICQGFNETSGIQFNGDYIMMWSPADSYTIRYFDEDSGNEVWNIDSSGVFSGIVRQVYLHGTTTSTLYLYGSTTNTAGNKQLYTNSSVYISNNVLYGAAWNDYAEYRKAESIEPGRVVIESTDGEMKLSTERLQPGAEIISDTFGFAIGETNEYKTPIAAAGRVLAYPNEDRYSYPLGCAVCSGPNGTISQMTREEIREYSERIIGTVSEIPDYETWGEGNVSVDGRIWIRIK